MSKLEKHKEKARNLEAKDPKGAIEAWLEILKLQEEEGEANPDLSIFNRVGDLYLKVKDPAQAADYYDRAVDKYAELGFHNNAIAMCNKVHRNAPGRQTTYLKLAKLYAAKGFMAEAKQNFVEYAERMQRLGKIQQAFSALKEFTDISPESAHLRQLLEEHLHMYGDPGRRTSAVAAPPAKSAPPEDLSKSGKRKTSSLVFLDVDEPPAHKAKPGARPLHPATPATPTAPPPAAESLIEPVTADPDTSLEIESTSLVEGLETAGGSRLEGFETTSADFGEVQLGVGDVGSLREEVTADDVPPMMDLEPTVPTDAEPTETDAELEPLLDDEIEIEAPAAARPAKEPAPPRVPPAVVPRRPGAPGAPPARVTVPKMPKLQPPAPPGGGGGGGGGTPKVKPVVPRRPEGPPGGPPKRKTVVEVPPLELEPDFETVEAEAEGGAEDDAASAAGRRSGYIDLGIDEGVNQGEETGSLVFANAEATPAKPTIDELEARVADDPDDPEAHQDLGEALIEEGERERGIEELDHASTGYENRGNLEQAQGLVDEILKLDPNSVRHRQKLVEYAFKSGDKAKLIDAYLELADTLLRQDLPDKARAVYQRVAEHDPTNERAKGAIAMLAPVAPAPQAKPEKKVAAKDAKMKVRDETEAAGDFVDLSAMVLEEEMPERDTRMKIADEEPTGDEERDFHDMLTRFRQGIEENIDEADFQSHYDLGIAFKEMGLL